MDIERIQARLKEFSTVRDWDKYHSPKNLAMALSVEAAELMEMFQWVEAEESRNVVNHRETMDRLCAELSDVLIYAIRLADVVGIDLNSAIMAKLDQNEEKHLPNANRHWSF